MKYTYDDFIKSATGAGVMDRFTADDLTVAQRNPEYGLSMVGLMGDLSKATTEEQRVLATEAVNQLRKNYGVAGGSTVQSSAVPASGTTETIYQKQLNILSPREEFSYDPENDPSFQAYRKAYLREGERASADALAKASAASGGIPSSYAVTTAQQAGNYYAGKLADMIPTLEQNAYQRYLDRYTQEQQRFENAMTLYKKLGYATPEIAAILGIPETKKKSGGGGTYLGETGNLTVEESVTEEERADGTEYRVVNQNNASGVRVGNGGMSWAALEQAVRNGSVKEIVDEEKKTIQYIRSDDKTHGASR